MQALLGEKAPFVQGWSLPTERLHLISAVNNSHSLAPLALAYRPVTPQAPCGCWLPHEDVVESTMGSCKVKQQCSLSSIVLQQWCESQGWALLSGTWTPSAFRQVSNEISPSTSALFFILLFSALSLSGSVAHLEMSLQTLGLGIISPDFSYLKFRHKVWDCHLGTLFGGWGVINMPFILPILDICLRLGWFMIWRLLCSPQIVREA